MQMHGYSDGRTRYLCATQPPLKKKVFLVLEFEPNSPENSSVEPDESSKRNDAGHEQSERSKNRKTIFLFLKSWAAFDACPILFVFLRFFLLVRLAPRLSYQCDLD